jgi:hypothetical protein
MCALLPASHEQIRKVAVEHDLGPSKLEERYMVGIL